MRAVTDDSAYRVQFLVRGFRGVWLPIAPATVWAVGIAAAFVAVPAAFDAWGPDSASRAPALSGSCSRLPSPSSPRSLRSRAAVVSRLHSPTTPFPGHYVRVLRDELRAPRSHADTARIRVRVGVPGPLNPFPPRESRGGTTDTRESPCSLPPTILTRLRDRAVARRDQVRSMTSRSCTAAVTSPSPPKPGAWAYYALGAHAWTGRPDDVNDQAVIGHGASRRDHRAPDHPPRVPRAVLVGSYRDGLTGQAGARPDDTPGARSFRQLTDGAVTCLRAYRAARARVFLGVRFTGRADPVEQRRLEAARDLDIRITHSAAEKTREALAAIDRSWPALASPGHRSARRR